MELMILHLPLRNFLIDMPLSENQVVNDRRLLGYIINGDPDEINNILQFDNVKKEFIWIPTPLPQVCTQLDGVNVLSYPIVSGSGVHNIPNPNVEFVYASQTLTALHPKNKGFIRYTNRIGTNSTGAPRNVTFRLREDDINGAILSSSVVTVVPSIGGAQLFDEVVITDQPVGARSYVRTLELGSGIALYGFNGAAMNNVSPVTLVQYLVDLEE